MSSTDHIDEGAFVLRLERAAVLRRPIARRVAVRRPMPAPLRAASATVYATTLVLALLMPHAVIDWLDDLPPGPLNTLARSCMEPVAVVSDRLGLHDLYAAARRRTEALSRRAQ